jgi:hypothetical protein
MPDQKLLERERLLVVLSTVFLNVIVVTLLVFAPWSDWKTGMALNLADNAILLWFIITRRDSLLGRFLVFGLAVGLAELVADAWLVDHTRTLDYSIGGGPILWRSPVWMPFAWEIVAVQFGYLGLRLAERLGALGLLGIGIMGAINIPYYEEMARRIHWWQYRGCNMISNTPYYIVLGEFVIAIAFAILARTLRRGRMMAAICAGIAGGLVIFLAYALSFFIADGLPRLLQ